LKRHPHDQRSLLDRLVDLISPGPDNKPEFLHILYQALQRRIIDAEGLAMIEGIMQISELTAQDIMIPRTNMDMLDISHSLAEILPKIIQTSHSRFPVYDTSRDQIMGVLLAKDLLGATQKKSFDWRQQLRPALFIPESKPLNILLREFRVKKNHLALVVDEFSQVVGMVTIEDVIEQITGDIEDEYDFDEDSAHIIPLKNQEWRVNGLTTIDQFNAFFDTALHHDHVETVGGIVTQHFGRLPHKGEIAILDGWRFEVMKADDRQLHLLKVRRALPQSL